VLRELTQNGAVYFDPTSEESMTDTLTQALNDHPLRQAVIERGLRRARYFTWDRAAERMLKVYAQARES
jgi:glycosyltransferase involved in cell wall biosynthesis